MQRVKIIGNGSCKGSQQFHFATQTCHRLAEGETFWSLIDVAIDKALTKAGISMQEIDCIVAAMATPLQLLPCNAAILHERYAYDMDIPALDIDTSCTSFITALDMISYMMQAGRYQRVLIVSGDHGSQGLNSEEKESYELFSDAATAFIVAHEPKEDSAIIYSKQKTWSEGVHDTEIFGGGALLPAREINADNAARYLFHMEGVQVLRLSAQILPDFIATCYREASVRREEVALVIPHQASRALGLIMKRLGYTPLEYVDRVAQYGNMISAAIPYLFCQLIDEGLIKRGDLLVLVGTAAGLTANFMLLRY